MDTKLQLIQEQISKLTREFFESTESEIEKANKIRDSFNVEIDTLKKDISLLEQNFDIDNTYYVESIDKKKEEISIIESRLSNLAESKKIIDELDASIDTKSKELVDIKTTITLKTDELGAIQIKLAETFSKNTKELDAINKQIDARQEEINKLRAIAVPTINQLDARKKLLDARENDLKIVEERLRAAYKKNGLNFKI